MLRLLTHIIAAADKIEQLEAELASCKETAAEERQAKESAVVVAGKRVADFQAELSSMVSFIPFSML